MSNDNYEIILQNLSNFIGYSNEIELTKENFKNLVTTYLSNINKNIKKNQ